MKKSESIKEISKALAAFHLKVGKIKKDATNPYFKSKYASLSNILEAIEVPLEEAGLVFSQLPDADGLTTILIHTESGEFLESTNNMQSKANDPQALGSAITYNRRYSLAAILGLNIDDDDDGNAATKPANGYVAAKAGKGDENWLSESQYKQILTRIAEGEMGLIEQTTAQFAVRKSYREGMAAAYAKLETA